MGLSSGTSRTDVPELNLADRNCCAPRSRRRVETYCSSTWIVWFQMMSSNVQSPQ
jgi:hypothetical protein